MDEEVLKAMMNGDAWQTRGCKAYPGTSSGNLETVLSKTLNRPARKTITDRGIAMIPLPDGAPSRDWRMHKHNIGICPDGIET